MGDCEGCSFESWGLRGKERGYNLILSGGNVKGEVPRDDRQVDRFVVYKVLYKHSVGLIVGRLDCNNP